MAFWIKTNGTIEIVDPKNGTDFKLEELQEFVGGFIEVAACKINDTFLIINEEGKLHGFDVNLVATAMYPHGDIDAIVGNALWCNKSQIK